MQDITDLIGKVSLVGKALCAVVSIADAVQNKDNVLREGTYRAEEIMVKSPTMDWYSHQTLTLYSVDSNVSYYEWHQHNAFTGKIPWRTNN